MNKEISKQVWCGWGTPRRPAVAVKIFTFSAVVNEIFALRPASTVDTHFRSQWIKETNGDRMKATKASSTVLGASERESCH